MNWFGSNSNVFRVPNGVAHGAQVDVFHVDVIVAQIDDFARNCIIRAGTNSPNSPNSRSSTSRSSTNPNSRSTSRSAYRFFFCRVAHNCGPIRILGWIVIAIARALCVRAQNGADSRQRGIKFGVFVDNVSVLLISRLKRRVRNHGIVNGDGVVFMPAIATVIHDAVCVRQPDVVHVAALGAKMHSLIYECCLN